MRAPIKLNRSFWPGILCQVLPSAADPRSLLRSDVSAAGFTEAVSVFKFGTTFKTTQKVRFPKTISSMAKLRFASEPVILDVGASDGTTSLDVMRALRFSKYFVTDLNTEVLWCDGAAAGGRAGRGETFFYDAMGMPILLVTDRWVIYNDPRGAIRPMQALARAVFARAPAPTQGAGRAVLINPAVRMAADGKVQVRRYDMFQEWPFAKADIVLAANILNRSYFDESQLAQALKNLRAALHEDGYLVVVDSRDTERSTIFRRSGEVVLQVNGGTEIETLASRELRGSTASRDLFG